MSSDEGLVSYCVDDTKPDGSNPCIMGFILADKARKLTTLTKDERCSAGFMNQSISFLVLLYLIMLYFMQFIVLAKKGKPKSFSR